MGRPRMARARFRKGRRVMELEIVNGFAIVKREFDRNGQSCILAVRRLSHNRQFEYVTAWHVPGDSQWWAGHYFDGHSGLENALSDFNSRVTL